MNADPVDLIAGLTTTADVDKAETVSYLKADLHCFADCATVRNSDLSGRTRIMVGSRFFRKDTADTSADDMTETTLVIIDGAGIHWLVIEGERYDMPFSFTGLIGDAEKLNAIAIVTPLMLPAGLPGSLALVSGLTAPTAETVVSYERSSNAGVSWSTLFTVTFAAGARTGTFTLAADTTLAYGDMIRPAGQATHDPTFSGFTATIAALR